MSFAAHLERMDGQVRNLLADSTIYQPAAGPAVEVRGVFDALYLKVELGQPGMSSQGPAVFYLLADLPDSLSAIEATMDDVRVTAAGVEYRPVEVQPDGKGGVLLRLHEVS